MTLRYIYILVLFLLTALPHNSFAEEKQLVITSDMQYEYGQTLFDTKDHETAMVEFKRFIHFFPDNKNVEQARFNIGVCLFNLKKFHDAARAFNDIIINSKEDNLIKEACFFQSRAFMNIGNTGYAQIVLQNYLKLVTDTETKDRIYFNLAKIHLADARNGKQGSLALAKKSLSNISDAGAITYHADQYHELIVAAEHAPKKNPKAAGLFAVIPGGGFLYCERYHDAFITFLLNIGLMAASYEAFDNDNKALAGVIAFVETGFYTGNIYGSISCAHKYNRAQTIKILKKEVSITSSFDPEKKGAGLVFNFEF
ncbi:tetratricopeptide repeat protein [Desulfobacula sp.]|uniref:tetratricopeptide repeat protein n=1 Tax=Desulfobacula sp. TaxID=2593537 RepID=UPI0025C1EAE4|nr:tetratricopeptide repeat protein [Desulfobacula sp.]MBC2704563.1 hypothetical protein [Desulfobacula sp.]